MKAIITSIVFLLFAACSFVQTTAKGKTAQKHKQKIYYNVGSFTCGLAPASYHGKWGYIDTNGREVIKCKYSYVSEFNHGKALVAMDESSQTEGIIDTTGKEIVPCSYCFVTKDHACRKVNTPDFTKDYIVTQNQKFGKLFNNGTVAFPCIYSSLSEYENGFAIAQYYNIYGLINETGEVKVPFDYRRMHRVSKDGLVAVLIKQNEAYRWGFIDTNGTEIIHFKYEDVYSFSEGLAAVKENSKWGYINSEGKKVIDNNYSRSSDFRNGYAWVEKDSRWGLINKNGKAKLPFVFPEQYGNQVVNGVIALQDSSKKYGMVDTNNKIVLPFKYNSIYFFSDNRAVIELSGKWGVIDAKGVEIIPCKFTSPLRFTNGLAEVNTTELNPKLVMIDTNGNQISMQQLFRQRYLNLDVFEGGLAAVENWNQLWGFINRTGDEVIKCQYDQVGSFSEGFAPVKRDSNWIFINKEGQPVFDAVFDGIEGDFKDGIVSVKKNGKYAIMDTTGLLLFPFDFNFIGLINDGIAPALIDTQWGYIDKYGEMIIKSEHKPKPFKDGIGAVYRNDSTFYINKRCEIILGIKDNYDHSDFFSDGLIRSGGDTKGGYSNTKGKQIIPSRYRYEDPFKRGFAVVAREDKFGIKWGIIDKKGRCAIPFVYDGLSNFNTDGLAIAI